MFSRLTSFLLSCSIISRQKIIMIKLDSRVPTCRSMIGVNYTRQSRGGSSDDFTKNLAMNSKYSVVWRVPCCHAQSIQDRKSLWL